VESPTQIGAVRDGEHQRARSPSFEVCLDADLYSTKSEQLAESCDDVDRVAFQVPCTVSGGEDGWIEAKAATIYEVMAVSSGSVDLGFLTTSNERRYLTHIHTRNTERLREVVAGPDG
jgi:hypothetical protein